MDITARFWSKVAKTDGCWLWTGALINGYGVFSVKRKNKYAHRFCYELLVGPITDGLSLDHVCHNSAEDCSGGISCAHRRCVRPDHLDPVTLRTNTMRSPHTRPSINASKTHCPQGHPLSKARSNGQRLCVECNRRQTRENSMARRRLAGIPAGRGAREKAKTHCPQGHAYDEANTRVTPQGGRVCRTCERAKGRRRYWAAKASQSG